MAGCACIALPALQGILGEWSPDSLTDYRRWWLGACGGAIAVLIVTSRTGMASKVPVRDELELLDATSGIYSATFYLVAAATGALLATASVLTIRTDGWLLAPTVTAIVGVLGAVSATITLVLLATQREWLAAHHAAVTTGWAPPLVGLLAAAGLCGIIRTTWPPRISFRR
ncbi:hypothetical protein ACFVH4_18805 [Nocardia ignorata]|uniref:hypothetical protein n=1 Tax=Nocardia ignorata TaxID=145285 RepID=UPI003625CD0A